MVIAENDTTLQEYYITRRYKCTIHEGIYIVKAERCSRAARGSSRAKQEKSWEEEIRRCPSFCCTLITTGGSVAHSDQLQKDHHGPDSRICVTPRFHGYGDVTATYIRRSEIPSRIYVKLQYRQESEAEAQW